MIYRKNLTPGFLALGLLCGCTSSSSSTSDTQAVSVNRSAIIESAVITPSQIIHGKMVFAQVQAKDLDGDFITFHYQWLRNGKPITGQTSSTFFPRMLKRGDLLAVDVTPYDGKVEGAIYRTDVVALGNTPPEVRSINLEPREPRVGDRIQVKTEGFDADDDPIEYRYRWWLNNEEIPESEKSSLETAGLLRGHTITVQVTPHDDLGGKGKELFAEPVIIVNSPPKITSVPSQAVTRKRYEYPVAASDPDGDVLVYSLEMSPPGMKINPTTGRIEWQIPTGTNGVHRARVKVTDTEEGFAFQEFDLIFPPALAATNPSLSKSRRSPRLVSRF